ncbi:MAG: hypothetical protein GAK35_01048 [Herbaspirillum frisingense]|uniref:Uncharacterized protein n=1 Tax=Herbaspirillum frisingense TaxID=92645 RepID=A0A7V8FYT1_9BURK|nr:MAG: hypothetical protein GAK35_01048 [Herbaspirillum frisingense]
MGKMKRYWPHGVVIASLLSLTWYGVWGGMPEPVSNRLAAWVQAIGAIAAVYGAYVIGRQQMVHDQALAKDAAAAAGERLLKVVRAVVNDVYQQILDVEEVFSDTDTVTVGNLVYPSFFALGMQYDASSYGTSVRRLEAIPVFDLGSETVAANVIALQEAASRLVQWFDLASRIALGPKQKGDEHISNDQAALVIRSHIKDARQAYEAIIAEVGGAPLKEGRPFRGKI